MGRLKHWILDEKCRPIEVDLFTWAMWFESAKRIVCQETIAQNRISTIFLGIDHDLLGDGPPVLWETMTFGAKRDGYCDRCAGTIEQAEAMHEHMVRRVCEAYGIDYDAARAKQNDPGVLRRQAAVFRRQMKKLDRFLKSPKALEMKRKTKPNTSALRKKHEQTPPDG